MIFSRPKFVVLMVLDGWGIAPESPGNAIKLAKTTNFNKYWFSCPHAEIEAAGQAVGLPRGEDGNTETGHLNLGAGRIVFQDLERINHAIVDGTFFENLNIKKAFEHSIKNNSNVHLLGLIGAGGVHSSNEHLYALIRFAKKQGVKNLYLHLFTDGRDSPPTSAKVYLSNIEDTLKKEGLGKIASITGRYWAMDRDNRWERTGKAYRALVNGEGNLANSAQEAIEKSYQNKITDEFVEPTLISSEGNPASLISANDSLVFFNFRIDRPRQIVKAFLFKDFTYKSVLSDFFLEKKNTRVLEENAQNFDKQPFERGKVLENIFICTLTEYSKTIAGAGAYSAFPPERINSPLGHVIANAGLKQLRATESEKERFVTYYFNGLRELPFSGEEKMIIPSPKVPTYDQKPEMSAYELTDKILEKLKTGIFSFILINFPNTDMVAHSGNIEPTVKAAEIVDTCLGRVANYCLAFDGALIATADHGNAEELINLQTGEVDTEHSNNRVPFFCVYKDLLGKPMLLKSGILADIAPTVLALLNIPIPTMMTGRNLLAEVGEAKY